ncbi:uncharacterized protein O3C94_015730 [Discoglossus pictus]
MVLSKKYGDVYTIYLGSRPVVIVTGYKTVKEILVTRGDEFLARGDLPMFDLYYKNYGVALTNNMERWKEMRRFTLNAMRGFGMGKRTTEERTLEEMGFLVAELRKMEGTTFNPHDLFSKANCHVLFTIIFGDRQKNEDEDIKNMLSYIHETFSIVCSVWGQVYEMFPRIMRYLPGGHQMMFRSFEKLLKLTEKRIEMNQKMLDLNNPTSYVDAFLIKMEKEKSNPKTEYHMTNLLCSTLQTFFAGVETTSTTMTYSILLLMKFPDVLAKVQEEIDRVIGQNRNPQVKDRNEMPYTDAVIHEIQRFSDILPMGVPRKVTQDVEFQGYNIPKGTNVFPMLGSVLKDPTCFTQPEEFNPNHFLDENGEFKRNDAFMPLSAGKRNCLGEALVRMQLFLFLVIILQNFSLKSPVPPEELDIKPNVSGLGNLPKPYKLAFIPLVSGHARHMPGPFTARRHAEEQLTKGYNRWQHLQPVVVDGQTVQGFRDTGSASGPNKKDGHNGGQKCSIPIVQVHIDWETGKELLEVGHGVVNVIMDATLFLALSIPLLIFFFGLKTYKKKGNLPPGPTPLPLLGNILHIKSGEIVKSLMVLSEKYGDVYTIYLGSRPVVIVTGHKAVKEILVTRGDEFLARGDMAMLDKYFKNYGVSLTNNMERWKEMRRFSVNTMRGFGMGKRTTEERTLEEMGNLVAELRKMEGTTFDPRDLFSKANCHTLFTIMFGERQENEDEDINSMLFYIHEIFTILCSIWGQIYEMFPKIMRFLPGGHQRMFQFLEKLLKLVEKRVDMNEKMLDPNNPTSYVDAFLIKIEKEKSNPKTEYHMTNLLCSTLQIFFAGVETTRTTMTYSILLLMKFPDVLAKVQEEIDRVIGQNRNPQVKDRNEMPYTDAVIHEIQRFSDILPMGVPRKVTQDVEFRGYNIPKGTNVFPMLGSVLKDPTCFPQPEEFNPNNFLDENGEFKKNDAFMPFSTGKRNCLGEALVRMQLFLFLVTILQNFSLKSPVPPEELDIKPNVSGLGNLPKPYKLAFIPR